MSGDEEEEADELAIRLARQNSSLMLSRPIVELGCFVWLSPPPGAEGVGAEMSARTWRMLLPPLSTSVSQPLASGI